MSNYIIKPLIGWKKLWYLASNPDPYDILYGIAARTDNPFNMSVDYVRNRINLNAPFTLLGSDYKIFKTHCNDTILCTDILKNDNREDIIVPVQDLEKELYRLGLINYRLTTVLENYIFIGHGDLLHEVKKLHD